MTCDNVMCLRTDRHRHDAPTAQENLLRLALQEAILEMESMVAYVPEYFRSKWQYDGAINAAKAALEAAK